MFPSPPPLFSHQVTSIAPFVVMLAWVGSTTAGHTKRLTTNAIVMIGYAVGNSAGPQYWKKQYQPRNHIPWLILSICWAVSALILLALRVYLARENAKREKEGPDTRYEDVYIEEKNSDGTVVEKKVDKVCLLWIHLLWLDVDVDWTPLGVLGPHGHPEP